MGDGILTSILHHLTFLSKVAVFQIGGTVHIYSNKERVYCFDHEGKTIEGLMCSS